MQLDESQLERYKRQIIVSGLGIEGQKKLLASRVLVIGLGGLGSPVAYYLAAAGVGTLGLLDSEGVELSNLQRQILHSTSGLGWTKVYSAEKRLHDLNPDIKIVPYKTRITTENSRKIVSDYDLVVDCVDNLDTRYIVNDACVFETVPLVEAGVMGFEGLVLSIKPGEGPCYRCIFPRGDGEPPFYQREPIPVMGPLVGMVGCIEAIEAIKILLDLGRSLVGRLLIIDSQTMDFREINISRNPNCVACGRVD